VGTSTARRNARQLLFAQCTFRPRMPKSLYIFRNSAQIVGVIYEAKNHPGLG